MREETNLFKKVGTKNPFKVPEHYFEDFTLEVMSRLPEKENLFVDSTPTVWLRIKPWLYMAAMFCGIMLSVRLFVGTPEKDDFPIITQSMIDNLTEEDLDMIIDRSRMDDYDLYQYLTEMNHSKNN